MPMLGVHKLNHREIPRRPNNGQSARSFRCLKRYALWITMNWLLLKKISSFLLAALLLALVADVSVFSFVEYGSKGTSYIGCYAYDAMLIGFECKGFFGSKAVSMWLNWPLWLIYSPVFAVFSIRAFLVAILVWSPIVAYGLSVLKLRKIENA
jgi:hypothetical protein